MGRGELSALGAAVVKLAEVVEEENLVLTQHRIIQHGSFTDRKNHALRELISAQRTEVLLPGNDDLSDMLRGLRDALQVNAGLLKHHISAVGEISDMLVGSMCEAESDGTYSRGNRKSGIR